MIRSQGRIYSPPTNYLFVDGESLRQTFKNICDAYFPGQDNALDWSRVTNGYNKTFYYDAIPVQAQGEDDNTYSSRVAPKIKELSNIEAQDGVHVRTGDVRHRRRRGNEQKMVDVQLAVDALLMASRGLFSHCTLVTGDLDFKPLVSALVDIGIDVNLMYPVGETNNELLAAADRVSPITVQSIAGWARDPVSFSQNLPIASFLLLSDRPNPATKLLVWHEEGYGECFIMQRDQNYIMVSESSPGNPMSHYLNVIGSDLSIIRRYAKDIFNISVPEA